jgi:hypothetical protein
MPSAKKDNSFHITVNKDALSEPLLETNKASSVQIRDSDGNLLFVLVMVPGFPVLFVSSADKDEDFESFCKNMGFELYKPIEKK